MEIIVSARSSNINHTFSLSFRTLKVAWGLLGNSEDQCCGFCIHVASLTSPTPHTPPLSDLEKSFLLLVSDFSILLSPLLFSPPLYLHANVCVLRPELRASWIPRKCSMPACLFIYLYIHSFMVPNTLHMLAAALP